MPLKRLVCLIMLFGSTCLLHAQQNLPREFRGVWVATVGNIDWPSSSDLSTEEQKMEMIRMLDLFKSLNFNAVIFQIRPSADAFYYSRYEPWSSYLTGTSDKSPLPYYDPLAFMIAEAHKRGMELHAWLNPYRAMVKYREFRSNPFRLTYEKSEWFVNYGENKYFNPGIPEVREYTAKVVADIVQNYDIDAIHFDDYFYPYKIAGEEFDDRETFKTFGGDFYPDRIDDWRRNNVSQIVFELHQTIKTIKPWVQFGISPFGVWRNSDVDQRGSITKAGQTNYDDLYADILLWIRNRWVDYILPQAYWRIGHNKVDYLEVTRWWSKNTFGTNLYIGHGLYRLDRKKEHRAWRKDNPTEIEKQLEHNKGISEIKGSVFFSAKSLAKNPLRINEALANRYFRYPALPPIADNSVKRTPEAVFNIRMDKLRNKQYRLTWESHPDNKEKEPTKFLIFRFKENETPDLGSLDHVMALTGEHFIELSKKELKAGKVFVIQAVSRNNNLSSPMSFRY